MNAWIERGERALEVHSTELAELLTCALQFGLKQEAYEVSLLCLLDTREQGRALLPR